MSGVETVNARMVASVANVAVVAFGAAMALTQLNIAPELVANAILLLIAAVCLAAAIAFGLGCKPIVEKYLESKYNDWNG